MRKLELMMKLLVLTTVSMCAVQPASAQATFCAPTGEIEETLADLHGERLRHQRDDMDERYGGTVYVWTNQHTGTYSILINPQPGMTCIIDAGQSDRLIEYDA